LIDLTGLAMPQLRMHLLTLAHAAVLVIATTLGAAADDTIVKRFDGGAAPDKVGIADASEDVELFGPQALTTDAGGNLFLLDQLNQRILRFNPKQPDEEPNVLEMPAAVQPNDLLVRKDEILVWDNGIRTLKASGEPTSTRGIGGTVTKLEEVSSRGVDDEFATSAFAQMGSQPPGDPAELIDQSTRAATIKQGRKPSRQYIASRGRGSVIADITPEKGDNSVLIEVRTMDGDETVAQLHLRVHDKLGAVEFLEIDNNDRLYILGENIPERGTGAATFVARYTLNGELEGVYELPLENTPITRRFVTISGDGDVYFLRTLRSGVEVVGVGFRPLHNVKVVDVRPRGPSAAPSLSPSGQFTAIAAVRPSNRQQVIETAFAFEGLQWLLTPQNYGPDPDTACSGFSRVRRPWYLQGKVGQQVRGVPYCWGCHGSLASFQTQMQRGVKAGNVCTRNEPRGDVAGVDCSAFVSAAWGLSVHYTTAAIPAIASPVSDPWSLRPGDALDKPGSHVMLFLRFTPDRKAEVMESSTGGCNGRVCRNVYPLAALLARGYQPVRFKALADDSMAVAQSAYAGDKPEKATKETKETSANHSGRRKARR
jgi:cell wall-associated NlpC family hydrolase